MYPVQLYAIVMIILETIFIVLHIAMIRFILIKQKQKEKTYMSQFYVFFVHISVIDNIYVLNNTVFTKIPCLTGPSSFFQQSYVFGMISNIIAKIAASFEVYGHALITFQRYMVLRNFDAQHNDWGPKIMLICNCSMYFVSIIVSSWFFFTVVYIKIEADGSGGAIIYENPAMSAVGIILAIIFDIIILIPQTIFTILTFHICHKLSKNKSFKSFNLRNEIKLYFHSFIMFLCFIIRCIQHFSILLSTMKSSPIFNLISIIFVPFASLYALCGTPFLLILSKNVRNDFYKFYNIKWLMKEDDGIVIMSSTSSGSGN